MRKVKCLLLKTKDNRRFFTKPDNLPQLIEFSRTFGAEMSIVRVEPLNLPILNLSKLAPAICDPRYDTPVNEIETIDVWPSEALRLTRRRKRKTHRTRTRKRQLQLAKVIRSHIRKTFLRGSVVDVVSIIQKFKKYNLKLCTISNHLRFVRDQLVVEGREITKMGVGKYKLGR